ncbi:hypothetical protein HMPREF9442_01688 [Paraprevotella xylaniphila YIT 11841]|uniref:Uncharacterized protein n=1 Tax=Paraprevotella xylaniphila YIT 11841 TaxID=762982 RepID=F3QU19_9BACT|nr:hypothetical protein HMPREF9442_01688 [Paraprevotella xylaniphila YIT 11841]
MARHAFLLMCLPIGALLLVCAVRRQPNAFQFEKSVGFGCPCFVFFIFWLIFINQSAG